jgi:hypothetical protein
MLLNDPVKNSTECFTFNTRDAEPETQIRNVEDNNQC